MLQLELDLADRHLGAPRPDRAAVEGDLDLRRRLIGVGPLDQDRLAAEAGLEHRLQLVGQDEAGEIEDRRVLERGQARRRIRQRDLPLAAHRLRRTGAARRLERLQVLAPGLPHPERQPPPSQPVVLGVVVNGHELARAYGAAGMAAQKRAGEQPVHRFGRGRELELNLLGSRIGQERVPRIQIT